MSTKTNTSTNLTNNAVADKDKATKKDIISYGLGGAACTMPAQFKTSFSMNFLSDVARINVGVVGVAISIMTIWDAINDPIIGGIADRTNTKRWGKYRPHMMMGCILWAVVTFLLFTTPNLTGTAQLVYYITLLFFFSIFYTQFTVPWQALNSVMSSDPHQRNLLLTSRQMAGFFAGTLTGIVTMPIVNAFGNEKQGWMVAAAMVGVVCLVTGLMSANGVKTKDYYNAIPTPEKMSFSDQLNLVIKNRAVICAAILLGLVTLVNALNAAVSIYYLRYVVGNVYILSITSILSLAISMVIIPMMPVILKKIGKNRTLLLGMVLVGVSGLPLIVLRGNATTMQILVMSFFATIGFTVSNMTCMSLIPDCTDYTELHFGTAQAGFINAVITFMKKMCQSSATLIVGGLLALVHYSADTAAGNMQVTNMIVNIKILYPVVLLILTIIVLKIYPITPAYGVEMREKLKVVREQRKAEEAK